MERALIVKKEWLDKIFDDFKLWEMRSMKTNIRGRIGLIEAGSGLIVGEAELVDSLAPLSDLNISLGLAEGLHCVTDKGLLRKWRHPWVLKNAERYEKPIPYGHPKGAVIWVKMNNTPPV